MSGIETQNEELNRVLSELSLVHFAAEPTAIGDIPDMSKMISASVSRIRDLEVAIRWHQRKEALFIGYTEEARIACYNINQQIGSAISLYPSSKLVDFEVDIKSRTKFARRAAETSHEPVLTSLFSSLFKQYDLLLSCIESSSIEPPAIGNLVELTVHNTRVEVKDTADDFPELQSAVNANLAAESNVIPSTNDGLISSLPSKPKSSSGVVPAAPGIFCTKRHHFDAIYFIRRQCITDQS